MYDVNSPRRGETNLAHCVSNGYKMDTIPTAPEGRTPHISRLYLYHPSGADSLIYDLLNLNHAVYVH